MKVEIQPQETENVKMVSSIVNDLLDKLYGKREQEYKPKVIQWIVQPDPNMNRRLNVGVSKSSKVERMPNMLDMEKGNHGSKRKPPRSRYNNKDIDSTLSAESVNTDILGALGGRNGGRSIRRLTKKPLIG